MSKTIVIFGAGIGLGLAVARRFGRAGYRVALVARRADALSALAATLASEGIACEIVPADLSRPGDAPALVERVRAILGPIDVVYYAPIGGRLQPATEVDAAQLRGLLDLFLLTLIEITRAVLPEMLARGDGTLFVGHGASAVHAMPFLSGPGPAMAAARNYLGALHGEVGARGVYVGTLAVAAFIEGSQAHLDFASKAGGLVLPEGAQIPVVAASDLADVVWDMVTKRDRFEEVLPRPGA